MIENDRNIYTHTYIYTHIYIYTLKKKHTHGICIGTHWNARMCEQLWNSARCGWNWKDVDPPWAWRLAIFTETPQLRCNPDSLDNEWASGFSSGRFLATNGLTVNSRFNQFNPIHTSQPVSLLHFSMRFSWVLTPHVNDACIVLKKDTSLSLGIWVMMDGW